MDGESQGRLQDLLLLQAHAEGQEQSRHVSREVARELHAPAVDEQVDDREIEVVPPRRRHGLGAAAGTRDPLHQQGEFHLKFGDALTMALDFL